MTQHREGGGRRKKWSDLETYIVDKVRKSWECGAPLTPEQLQYAVMKHVEHENNKDAINLFVHGKRNTFHKFIQRVLKRNNFSV
jgi:hypothetical protein